MTTPWDMQPNSNPPEGETTYLEPLGIKDPLLPPSTLGQNLLNPVLELSLLRSPLSTNNPEALSSSITPENQDITLVGYPASQINQSLQSPIFTKEALRAAEQADLSAKVNSAIAPATTELLPAAPSEKILTPIQKMPDETSSGSLSYASDANLGVRQEFMLELAAPSTAIPASWSSIAELLGESKVTDNELPVVEPLWQEIPWLVEEVPMVATAVSNSGSGNQAATVPSSSTSVKYAETFSPQNGNVEVVSRRAFSPKQNPADIEALAESVYRLIEQRLAIQRERHGFYYRGRLPW